MQKEYLKVKIIEDENSKNFKLANDIYKELKIKGTEAKAVSFIITGLNFVYAEEISKEELKKIITDGRGDKSIDVIRIGKEFIDIFDFSEEDPGSEQMIVLKNSINDYIINRSEDLKNVNNRLRKILNDIHKNKNYKKKIRLFVVRNSEWKFGGVEMCKLEKLIKSTKGGEFNFFNRDKLINNILESENYFPEWKIPVNRKDKINFISDDKKQAFVRISLKNILNLTKKSRASGHDLFNKNVRTFLNNKNLLKQLKEVVDNEPEMFDLYHNGILITTPSLIERSSGCIVVEKPQIVNGAQTVNSLYELYKNDLKNKVLEKAKIICKIVDADKNLTNKICETSNTQIPIKLWDLRSNDDIQLIIERIINNLKYNGKIYYYYSRKGNNKNNKITIKLPEFIQWVYSIMSSDPSFAKNSKKKLFDIVSKEGKYGEIEKYLYGLNSKKINNICDSATVVNNAIKNAKKEDRGLLRDASVHLIAALYLKSKISEQYLEKLILSIKEYINEVRKKEPDITNNKIFTKDKKIWNFILSIK